MYDGGAGGVGGAGQTKKGPAAERYKHNNGAKSNAV
ncbi:hypothetical protein ABH924_004904, partial [Arthrobacter sp. GAS37]